VIIIKETYVVFAVRLWQKLYDTTIGHLFKLLMDTKPSDGREN